MTEKYEVYSTAVWFAKQDREDYYIAKFNTDENHWEINSGFGWTTPPGDTWAPATLPVFEGTFDECVKYIEAKAAES